MDRFIEFYRAEQALELKNLKSNMDRFIEATIALLTKQTQI